MKNQYWYLLRNVGILTVSELSAKVLVFLMLPLYTNLLSTAEYGSYELLASFVQLLFPILTANVSSAVMRYAMDGRCKWTETLSVGVRFTLLASVLFAVPLAVASAFRWGAGLEIYMFLYFFFVSIDELLRQAAKGLEKIIDMGIAGVFNALVTVTGNLLFLFVFRLGIKGLFLANILACAISSAFYYARIRELRVFSIRSVNRPLQKEMLSFSAPLIFSGIAWWLNHTLDKYAVALMAGVEMTGVLSVAYKIPGITNSFQSIFIKAWQVSAIKEYHRAGKERFYVAVFQHLNAMLCLVASGLILFIKPVAHLLYAKDFYVAWQYVPLLLLASVINASSGFLGPILSAIKNSKAMALSAVAGICVNAVANFLLIFLFGPQGAVVATALSSFVIFWMRFRAVKADISAIRCGRVCASWAILTLQASLEILSVPYAVEALCSLLLLLLNQESFVSLTKSLRKARENLME